MPRRNALATPGHGAAHVVQRRVDALLKGFGVVRSRHEPDFTRSRFTFASRRLQTARHSNVGISTSLLLTSCLHPTKRPRISCTCRGCGDCERNPLLQITPIQYQHQSTPVNSGLSPHWERLAYAQAQRQSPVVTAANVAQRLLRKHTLTSVRALLCPQGLVLPSARCSLPALVAECTLPHPRVATEHAANARIADGRPATAWD